MDSFDKISTLVYAILLASVLILYISSFITILTDDREPTSVYAWLILFILLPPLGLALYILFGRSLKSVSRRSVRKNRKLFYKDFKTQYSYLFIDQDKILSEIDDKNHPNKFENIFIRLLHNNSFSMYSRRNKVEILQSGSYKFTQLVADIESAKKYIHMQYYIWQEDNLTENIKNLLIKKSQEGVEVRILLDEITAFKLTRKYVNEMINAGIEIYPKHRIFILFLFHNINFRNHRKIIIIDGLIGYTGGMNMGEEYLNGGKKFKTWRDTHIRIEGIATSYLQFAFAMTWKAFSNINLIEDKYFVEDKDLPNYDTALHLTISGPDYPWESIEQIYFAMITKAQNTIKIQSPYFIPNATFLSALKIAALSGVNVELMITGIPDKYIPFWSAHAFFKDLLSAGVKIYLYKKGFLHAKTISIDQQICSIGTANMDIRSFKLNYEINTIIYDKKITTTLENTFEEDKKDCSEMTMSVYNQIPWYKNLRNRISKLFSPLL